METKGRGQKALEAAQTIRQKLAAKGKFLDTVEEMKKSREERLCYLLEIIGRKKGKENGKKD